MATVLSNALFRGIFCASPVAKEVFTTRKRVNISRDSVLRHAGNEATAARASHPIVALINSELYE